MVIGAQAAQLFRAAHAADAAPNDYEAPHGAQAAAVQALEIRVLLNGRREAERHRNCASYYAEFWLYSSQAARDSTVKTRLDNMYVNIRFCRV